MLTFAGRADNLRMHPLHSIMAMELKVPADKRQFALDTLQADIDFIKTCKLGKEKTYKKVCKA